MLPGKVSSQFCRVGNISSASCTGLTQIAFVKAVTKSCYKWGHPSCASNSDCRTLNYRGFTDKRRIILQIPSASSNKPKGSKKKLGVDAIIVFILRL